MKTFNFLIFILITFVSAGENVQKGDRLAIIEAMKMQHQIHAKADGIVQAIGFDPGAQVSAGSQLFALEIADPAA